MLSIALLLLAISLVNAAPTRIDFTPQRWAWRSGTEAELLDFANSEELRITDIEVLPTTTSELEYAAVFVDNTGNKKVDWFLYTNRTGAELISDATRDQARIFELDSIGGVFGSRTFAAVSVRDGPFPWSLLLRANETRLQEDVQTRTLIDIDPIQEPDGKFFTALLVDCGADCTPPRSLEFQKPARQIIRKAKRSRRIVVDIERDDDGKYSAILEKLRKPVSWWFFQGLKPAEIDVKAMRLSARVYDLEPYLKKGKIVYDVLMIKN